MIRQNPPKRPLPTEADRERLARAWADRMEDQEEDAGPARETYRDGGLISECWAVPDEDGR